MAYCTQADMVTQYGEVLLRDATDRGDIASGSIDAAAVSRAIASADALIDAALAVRYSLPLAVTPALVNELSMTIALYKLHSSVAPEKVRKDYEDALAQLKQIAAGTLKVADSTGEEIAGDDDEGVVTNEPERLLTAESMKGYI